MEKKSFLIDGIIGLDILPSQISDFLKSASSQQTSAHTSSEQSAGTLAYAPVKFQINSPGGFVFDAIAIHNLILQYPGQVEIEILSLCASSASFIATAGDIVSVFPDSVYMLHNAWLFSYGDHNKLRADADHIEKISNLLVNAYSNFSKKTVEEIKLLMNNETFLFGKEIIDNGFAHQLIEENNVANDTPASAIDYSKQSILASFNRMSAAKSFSQDILSAVALIDNPSVSFAQNFPNSFPSNNIAPSALSQSATSPEVADYSFSFQPDSPDSLNSAQNDSLVNSLNDNLALLNLFEKLSMIENQLKDLLYFSSANIRSEQSPNNSNQNLLSVDLSFFEYRLNALVNSKMILPAHKEIILNIIASINNFNSSSKDSSENSAYQSEKLFSLFEKLISLPSASIIVSSNEIRSNPKLPSDNFNSVDFITQNLDKEYRLDNSSFPDNLEHFDLPVDPQSRKNHLAILEIMSNYNCSYITAYSIFNSKGSFGLFNKT